MNQLQLKTKLTYDPNSGLFYRKLKSGYKIAGTTRKDGYVRICLDRKLYYAHQLAWLYQTGVFCENIDHKDTDKSNNRWANLRKATLAQQQFNRKGIKGYYYDKKSCVFRPLIQVGGKKYYGKSCKTEDEAKVVANDLKIKFHGQFLFWSK